MGIFTKPTSVDMALILPYIDTDVGTIDWTVTQTVDGVDTVSVTDYSDAQLQDAFDQFEADSEFPKVLRYAENYDSDTFTHLDYIRGLDVRLHPKRTFSNGILTQVDLYANVSFDANGQEVFDDLVVQEKYEYTRNADGFAVSRTLTISWVTESGAIHPKTKTRYKTYNLTESIKETNRRRSNILDDLKSSMIGLLVASLSMTTNEAVQTGQAFFDLHMNDILAFKEVGEVQTLINAVNSDSVTTWLDSVVIPPSTTMRQYIISILSGAILVGN